LGQDRAEAGRAVRRHARGRDQRSRAVPRHPGAHTWQLAADSAYVHITANETIHGVEFRDIPDVGDVPLVADFSSSIASEPLDVSRFGDHLRRRAEEPRAGAASAW
jgi:phosphoserine aminotransferase